MQKRVQSPANAGMPFRMNGSRDLRNKEASAGLHESGGKRRRRSGGLGTPGGTVRNRMKTGRGRLSSRAVQGARSCESRALTACHLALRLIHLCQQRHHRHRPKQKSQGERENVPSAAHLSAVYNGIRILQQAE